MQITGESPYKQPFEATGTRPDPATENAAFSFFGEEGFDFADLIDIVNPLQHIPLVSTMYREMTDDAIAPGARMIGSTLFFGPIGLAGAVTNVAVEHSTGRDIGGHVADWFDDKEPETEAVAEAPAGTDASTASGGFEDPVVAWARQEQSWQRRGAGGEAPAAREPKPTAPLPDANSFLGDEPWAALQQTVAVLSNDSRSASNAYLAAAGLRAE